MAKGMFDVECPCCQAILKVDPETRAVIAHTVPERPRPIEDLAAEVAKLKGEGARRDERAAAAVKSRGALSTVPLTYAVRLLARHFPG